MLLQKRSTSTGLVPGPLQLSPEDVRKLMSPETGEEGRKDISTRVAANYADGKFNATEAVVAEQIFRLLLRDTEAQLRAMLAEKLKNSTQLPRDIVIMMARDVEDKVALPVLRYSEVLTENDLLDIVDACQAVNRQVAISERRIVPETLASRLLATYEPEVMRALANNKGAVLSQAQLKILRARFAEAENPAEGAVLPPAVTEKVASAVSEHLAAGLTRKYQVSEAHLHSESEKVRIVATLNALRQDPTPYETEKLMEQLHTYGRFTPELLFASLADGHVDFFIASLAHISGLTPDSVRTLLSDRGDLGFRAVYNKAGLPASLFSAARRLLVAVQETAEEPGQRPGNSFADAVLLRLKNLAAAHPSERLPQLIDLIQPAFS